MGIFLGVAGLAGLMIGQMITILLGSIAFAITQNANRRIYAWPFFTIMFAIVLLPLMLVVSNYPYEHVRPGNDYDILMKNIFMQGFGYSASVGVAALLAALAVPWCPVYLCSKRPLIEIMRLKPKPSFVNSISRIFIIFFGLGMLGSAIERLGSAIDLNNYLLELNRDSVISLYLSIYVFLIITLILFISIGLLRRQNWARTSIRTLLVMVILWNLIGFVLVFPEMIANMTDSPTGMVFFIITFLWILALVVPLLIVFRLNSNEIKSEFISK